MDEKLARYLEFAGRYIVSSIPALKILQCATMGIEGSITLAKNFSLLFSSNGHRIRELHSLMLEAKSYSQWEALASELDRLNSTNEWRQKDQSSLYDCNVVKRRIAETEQMMRRGDVFDLIFRIRGGLARDQFGLQHEGLFNKALAGTKHLVEKYHRTISQALEFICDSPISDEEVPTDAKLAFFNETRHSYGRTALLLSGGAYLGYYHIGLAKTLWQEGLLPRVISGASAGSLIAAGIGTRLDEEFEEMYSEEGSAGPFRFDFFKFETRIRSNWGRKIYEWIPSLLQPVCYPFITLIFDHKLLTIDHEHFINVCKHDCGLYTFQEAFDRTGRIINITVAPVNPYDPPRLLNYLTAPHVCVWSAAVASCAIPGVFDCATLWVKEPNGNFRPEHEWSSQVHLDPASVDAHLYTDGSLENDLPMQQLSELFNINHFIVSQVNVHSALLSSLSLKRSSGRLPILYTYLIGYIHFAKLHIKDWIKHFAMFLGSGVDSRSWKKGPVQALTQAYEGREHDITVMPWVGHISLLQALLSVIKNPSLEEYLDVVKAGANNLFAFIPRIKAHCMVEMTLDKCVQKLRKRIAEQAHELTTDARGDVASTEGSRRGHGGLKVRQDSFYTTRSIINLSGLSVADPAPIASFAAVPCHPSSSPASKGSLSPYTPLSETAADSDLGGLDKYVGQEEDNEERTIQLEIPLKKSPAILKSTNMASFYYKRSESSHALNAMESPFG